MKRHGRSLGRNLSFFFSSLSLTPFFLYSHPSLDVDSALRERARRKLSRSTAPQHWKQTASSSRNYLPRKKKNNSERLHWSRSRRRACSSAGGAPSIGSKLPFPFILSPPLPTRPCGSPSGPGSPPTRPASPGSGAQKACPRRPFPQSSSGRRRSKSRGRSGAAAPRPTARWLRAAGVPSLKRPRSLPPPCC